MDIRITFEILYEILRKEKFRPELQKLDQKFFENLIRYLQEKQAILESQKGKDSIFSQEIERTQAEIINIRKMIKELYEKRELKIIQLATLSTKTTQTPDLTPMLKEEQILFKNIKEQLTKQREDILNNILETKIPKIRTEKPKDIKSEKQLTTKLIRFTHSIPKFVAEDLNNYGPFIEEDVANLPIKTAQVLITNKRAEEIK